MPSPIAHSVSGYVLTRLPGVTHIFPRRVWPKMPLIVLYGLVVTNLPDLDFLPQILTGARFHRGPSHSLLAALVASGILAGLIYRRQQRQYGNQATSSQSRYRAFFVLTLGLYGSHILLDLLTNGGSGLPLFWPLSSQSFQSPLPIFPAVHHSRGLWDASHLIFISVELLYSLCLLTGLRRFKATAAKRCPSSSSS